MLAALNHWLLHSPQIALSVIFVVTFIESLAIIGLLLPGTVLMTTVGALIGSGKIDFYWAWLAASSGCLAGDWLSYWLGRLGKARLHRWSFLQKHQALLQKTELALYRHNIITLLMGRFIGPTRPIVPMLAGMLDLPFSKFALANLLACLCWPPLYFLPGLLAGVAIEIPNGHTHYFTLLLVSAVLLLWLVGYLLQCYWQRCRGQAVLLPTYLQRNLLPFLMASVVLLLLSIWQLSRQPMLPVYWQLLKQVLLGHALLP